MCAASVYPEPGSNSHVISTMINFVILCQTSVKISSMYQRTISSIFLRFPCLTRFSSPTYFILIITNQILFEFFDSYFTLSRLFILVVLLPLFIGFSKFIVYFSMCFLSSQFHLSGTNLIVLYLITYVNTFFELFKSFFVSNFFPKKYKIIN